MYIQIWSCETRHEELQVSNSVGFHGLSWCPQGGAMHRRQTPDSESRSLSVTLRGLAFACKRCVTGPQRSEVPSYSMIAMA